MTALYEELVKSGKKLEKVGTIGKNWESIFLTVYEALHMKIYEAPSYEFWRAAIAGKRRAVPGSIRSAGQRREASDSVRELRKLVKVLVWLSEIYLNHFKYVFNNLWFVGKVGLCRIRC